jgi:ketosteroid isomerase-like protein
MNNDGKQSFALATTPDGIVPALLTHINSLDVETIVGFYHPESVFIDEKGHEHRGADGIGAQWKKYFSFGLPITITQRHLFVEGDTALLILDWTYVGTARDGTEVNLAATATDVARRGDDGFWRYLIDNAFGTQRRDEL